MSLSRRLLIFLSFLSLASFSYSAEPAAKDFVVSNPSEVAVSLSTKGTMKEHFRKGMALFMHDRWEKAAPELIAATMIVDPFTWKYWYAEAYATLGVIYQFHMKDPDHLTTARKYYTLALKRDPKTKSANYFLGKMDSKGSAQ